MKIAIDIKHLDHEEVQRELFNRGYAWRISMGPCFRPLDGIGFIFLDPSNKCLTHLSEDKPEYLLERIGQGKAILRTLEEL